MIGVGGQGTYDDARGFAARHGITFRMFWDRHFDSWDGFYVRGTPTSVLVTRGGTEITRYQGAMDDEEQADAVRRAREQG